MTTNTIRKYLTINDIQREYLPVSKKKLRAFSKKYLSTKVIGNRLYVERKSLEDVLTDPNNKALPL